MTTTHDDKAREQFEHWFSDEGKSPAAVERSGDGYKLMQAQAAWWAWEAAWNRRAALSPASTGQEAAHLARMKWQAYELDGVIADVEQGNGFDDICLNTVKRVRNILAQLPGDVAATAQQVEAEKWISVTERRPEKGDTVIGYWKPFRDNPIMPSNFGTVTYAGPNEWHNPEDDEDTFTAPSHWMPLPKPPAAGSKNGEKG